MSRRTTLTVVTLLCLHAAFGDRATADHRGRTSAAAGASSVGRISSLFDENTTGGRPLAAISGSRAQSRRYETSSSHGPLAATSKLNRLPTGNTRRASSFLSDIDRQDSPSSSASGPWPPGARAGLQLLRYQRRDDQNQNPSRRKKLKSDVFYAVRGRRGYSGNDDDNDRQDDVSLLTYEGPEMIDNDWMVPVNLIGGRGRNQAEQSTRVSGFDEALAILNDEQERNQEFERPISGGEGWSSFKEKREPPSGFHAIRGKRFMYRRGIRVVD